MKKILIFILGLAMIISFSACSTISMDTIKYANGEVDNHMVQTGECTISVTATEPKTEEQIQEIKKATKIYVEEVVMFDFDKAVIRDDQQKVLDGIVKMMNEFPDTYLFIAAFASTEGPEKYNQKLSERRAEAVKNELLKKGVQSDRIVGTRGEGETSDFGDMLDLNRRALVLSVD